MFTAKLCWLWLSRFCPTILQDHRSAPLTSRSWSPLISRLKPSFGLLKFVCITWNQKQKHCLKHWQIRRIILKGCDKTLRKDKHDKGWICLQHLCCDGRPLGKVPGWPDCPWLLCLAGLAQLPDQPWRVEDLGEDSSSITILSPMTGQADCSAVKNEQASITAALAKRTNSSLCQCWKQPLSMETWGGINDGSICLWEHGWVSTPFICFLVLYMS